MLNGKKITATITLILISTIYLAQKNPSKVSVDKIKTANHINDLVPEFPKDCKVYSAEVSVTGINGLRSAAISSDSVCVYVRKLLPKPVKGNKIFIAIATSSCFGKSTKEYKLVVE